MNASIEPKLVKDTTYLIKKIMRAVLLILCVRLAGHCIVVHTYSSLAIAVRWTTNDRGHA